MASNRSDADADKGKEWKPSGMSWRISASIISFFGLIIFIILWLFFYASGYTMYQNLAVGIVAVLVFFAIMGSCWASMCKQFVKQWEIQQP